MGAVAFGGLVVVANVRKVVFRGFLPQDTQRKWRTEGSYCLTPSLPF